MMLHRRAFTRLLSGLSLAAAAGATASAQPKVVEVSMRQGTKVVFLPAVVTINAGDTVKWTNPGYITHSVTFDPAAAVDKANVALPKGVKPFDSGPMEQEATYSHEFTVKGTYKYVCKYHEAMGMIGTVIVV